MFYEKHDTYPRRPRRHASERRHPTIELDQLDPRRLQCRVAEVVAVRNRGYGTLRRHYCTERRHPNRPLRVHNDHAVPTFSWSIRNSTRRLPVYLRLKLLFTLLPDAVPHICSCLARLYVVPFTPVCEPIRFLALAAVRRWLTSPPSPTSTTPLRFSGILFLSPTLKLLSSLPRCFCAKMLCYLLALPCVS